MPNAGDATDNQDVVLCTCSMPADLELFRILARSIDDHVDPSIRHLVIVPRDDLDVFRPFETDRREILPQEDVSPVRLFKAPSALRRLAPLHQQFRRPLYFDRRLRLVRGWILQQLLKLEISRRRPERAIVHVDSDVCFVKPFAPSDAFLDGRPKLFRVRNDPDHELNRDWTRLSAEVLAFDSSKIPVNIYIENCIVWSTDVVRALVRHIEKTHGRPVHEVLNRYPTFSEYVLYGVFACHSDAGAGVAEHAWPLCATIWDDAEHADRAVDAIAASIRPEHVAVAIQSTVPITSGRRADLFQRIAAKLADTAATP